MPRIRVAIVEDDLRLRRSVSRVVAAAPDCELVAAYATGAEAVAGLPAVAPDVILMDINLPDTTGVECVAAVAPALPQTQILMVTVYQDADTTFQAIKAGAHGYLVKPVLPARLLAAIRDVRQGGVPMTPVIARKVLQSVRDRTAPLSGPDSTAGTDPSVGEATAGLTPRELQVIELLVDGYSYKDAARQLGVTLSTVGTHVMHIYQKLHVSCRREIVAWARRRAP
jgi:DNA-binding NarL/FixJ family response regulator